jgi:hypothetical protein
MLLRQPCCVAGIAVANHVHVSQVMMATPESLQFFEIVHRIFRLDACRFHQAAVNDQEVQKIDRSCRVYSNSLRSIEQGIE